MSHTPGPWKTDADGPGGGFDVYSDAAEMVVAPSVYMPEDARLIAAAPDLLAALQEIVEGDFTARGYTGQRAMRDIARAAIAKADVLP